MAFGCVWLVLLLSTSVNGLSIRSETSRDFSSEDKEMLLQILTLKASELGSLAQSGRKLLQTIREWHGTHPAESVFAKCIVHYWIAVKIPEIVATADDGNIYEHGRRVLTTPVWIGQQAPEGEPQPLQNFQDSNAAQNVSNRISDNRGSAGEVIRTHRSLNDDGKFAFKRKVLKALYLLYMELKDFLSDFKLVGCSVHYLIAKFWEWVDNAP